jgi:polysaccharide export outer membrane protein
MTRIKSVAAALCVTGLLGCGGSAEPEQAPAPESAPSIVDLADPSQPLPVEQFMRPEMSRIAPGDELEIRAYDNRDLSGIFIVPPDGKINLALIGSVGAAGKSVEELDAEITEALGSYFRNLDVTVNVLEHAPRNVFVLGQVGDPGRYAFGAGDRVIHAVALAGGMNDKARENGIALLRREPDGQDHVYRLDFSSFHEGNAPQDIYLQPSDVILVPKSRFHTITDFSIELLDVVNKALLAGLLLDDLVNIRSRTVAVTR